MSEFTNLMVDIETMGSGSYSSIISIAAVEFDINTGIIGDTFLCSVSLEDCVKEGLKIDPKTVFWWLKQNKEAREKITNSSGYSLRESLQRFSKFIDDRDLYIWAKSPRFDLGILQNAYNVLDIPIPWNFRKEQCVRTICALNKKVEENWEFVGTPHNPVDDCINQIGCVTEIYKGLRTP